MVSNDDFKNELRAQMGRATARGASHVFINVRDLHASLGDFPGPTDEMVPCCLTMQAEMVVGDVVLVAESNERGMTVRYALPRSS